MIAIPRPYQYEAADKTELAIKTEPAVVVVAPTGSGKTIIMSELARRFNEQGLNVMLAAPRHELIGQMCEKLDQWCGLGYGLITADRKAIDLYARIQVASVDTLVSRVLKRKNLVLPRIDILMIDEAHLYITEHRLELMALIKTLSPNTRIIGFTATPGRHDNRGLGQIFTKMIGTVGIQELVEMGHLVPLRYLAPSAPDMEKVKVSMGEYNQKQTAERMMPLLGDICSHWLEHAANRRTIVFAQKVEHSVFLAESFREHGISAEHCDGTADTKYRDAVFGRVRSGETQVLCNVDLATYGFDLPEAAAIVLARPTMSLIKYLQMIGRGMRASPGKQDCIVLDHAGNVHQHGKADEKRYWSLDGVKDVAGTYVCKVTGERKKKPMRNLACPKCAVIFIGSLTCPTCGYYFEALAQKFVVEDGVLIEIEEPKAGKHTELQRMRFFVQCKGHGEKQGYKTGWAAYAHKERYGKWPPKQWNTFPAEQPDLETSRYLKYKQIRRAKQREKEERMKSLFSEKSNSSTPAGT